MTDPTLMLLERLHAAGITDVVTVEPAMGGLAATAGLARRVDGASVFVKAFGRAAVGRGICGGGRGPRRAVHARRRHDA